MKQRLQTLLKHKLQWLVLLTALLGVSQGVWAHDWAVHGTWDNKDNYFENGTDNYSVSLSAGQSYTFNIRKSNGNWYGNNGEISQTESGCNWQYNPNGDQTKLTTSYAGTYLFHICYYGDNYVKLNVTFPDPVKIKGDWDSWTLHNMSYSSSSWSYTQTFSSTGTYNFVIKPQSGSDYRDKDFTRADNSQTLIQGSSDATIDVDIPGDYTFTWNSSTKVLTITYPSHPCYSSTDISNIVNEDKVMCYFETYGWGDNRTGITSGDKNLIGTATSIGSKDSPSHGYATMDNWTVARDVYVTNNGGSGNWEGRKCAGSQTGSDAAGAYYRGGRSTGDKIAATTAAVTLSSSSIPYGTASIYLTIVGSDTESSYGEMLFAQIFVDGTKVGCQALAESPGSVYTLNTSSLTVGDHTIITILTDGTIYYIGDTDVLTVTDACSSAPVIGTPPQDTEVCKNGSASLTIAATITVGTPTYQWYTCNSDGSGESSIGSATGTSYTLPTSTAGTYYYKCKATGCGKTTTSRVATVTVDATSVAGSISALANPICSGTETTLRIPNGNTGSITQWQYYNTASSQWTNLGTSATQATGNLTAATQYKAFVKNGVCDAVPSSTYIVNLKTAPSKPSISGNEIMCGPSESGAYTYTSTDVSADRYNWTVTGAALYSGDGTRNITVTAGDVDNSPVTIAVTAVNCPNNTPLSTAADNYSATIYKSASAGTVSLSKSSVCVNESGITASRSGTWYTGGGSFEWSSANTTYATVSSASAASPTITAKKPTSPTVSIRCTITSPTCGSSVNSSAALTINGPAAFTINQDPASPKPWEVVTLSTSTSASANWSITSNPSGKAYLNTTSGSSTKLKAPYDASANTVKASITSGGCTQEATESVSISSEACN